MVTYKLHYSGTQILRLLAAYTQCIPVDNANSDYQEFLKWRDAGNTPDPADPAPTPSPT